jgi:hypothetical protein
MTKDEIMKMAHEAGLHIATDVNWMPIIGLKYAEAFAKLVAQHEREACAVDAEWCIQNHLEHHIPERIRARGQA